MILQILQQREIDAFQPVHFDDEQIESAQFEVIGENTDRDEDEIPCRLLDNFCLFDIQNDRYNVVDFELIGAEGMDVTAAGEVRPQKMEEDDDEYDEDDDNDDSSSDSQYPLPSTIQRLQLSSLFTYEVHHSMEKE